MKRIFRCLACAAALMLPFLQQHANAYEYLTKSLSIDDGLSQSTVRSIVRDSKGYLWIGTTFGLNRYDYTSMVNYYHSFQSESSIPDNDIRLLFEDSRQTLWVAGNKGVAVYDRNNNDFIPVKAGNASLNIRSYYQEKDGLLLGGGGKLYYFDYATDHIVQLQAKGGSKFFYTHIHKWKPGWYVLTTRWDGIWLFERATATIKRLESCTEKNIMATFVDKKGNLWVSPYGEGILCYDNAGNLTFKATSASSELQNDIILDIIENEGEIWFATDGNGIQVLDTATKRIHPLLKRRSGENYESIPVLYKDAYGNMYAGTVREGALLLQKVSMHTFQNVLPGNRNLRVVAIHAEGNLSYYGDDGNGIIVHDLADDSFRIIPSAKGLKVTGIAPFDANTLMVATFDKGIFLLNKRSGTLSHAPSPYNEIFSLNEKKALITHLQRLQGNKMAIITDEIYLCDIGKGQYTVVQPEEKPKTKGQLSPFYCNGSTMLCTNTNCVFRYDVRQDSYHRILTLDNNHTVKCAQYDGSRYIYLGTSQGLVRYDMQKSAIEEMDSGQLSRITTMALDGNRLWIGAANTLFLRQLKTGNTVAFSQYDGVAANEFIPNAVHVSADEVYMGGVNGLLKIDKKSIDDIIFHKSEVAINLAEIEVDGIPAYKDIVNGQLSIPSTHASIGIRIIDMEQNPMRSKRFRYHVMGASEGNYIETADRQVKIPMLPPGRVYDVYVSCSTPDGGWSEPVKVVSLDVSVPWWQTWQARTVYVLLIIAAGYAAFLYVKNKKRKQADEKRRIAVEKEMGFLVNVNHELRTPLTMIYAPLKLLIEKLRNNGGDPAILSELRNIYKQTKKMRDVIDMTLDLWRTKAAQPETNLTPFNFSDWLHETIDGFKSAAGIKNANIVCNFNAATGNVVLDKGRLTVAMNNILMNAVKHAPEGSEISIRTHSADGHVRIEVADSGESMDEPEEMFSKYSNDDNLPFGSGLGLAYAKLLIEMQNGKIGASSDKTGVTVWIELPTSPNLPPPIDGKQKDQAPDNQEKAETGDNPHQEQVFEALELTAVVVVEDLELCLFLSMQLKRIFKKVQHAFNSKEALILARSTYPDIIISSDLKLCRSIKQSPEMQHIPIIYLAASNEVEDMKESYSLGVDSYITKPFDMDVLISRCKNLLLSRISIKNRYKANNDTPIERSKLNNAAETFLLKVDELIEKEIQSPDFSVDTIVKKMLMSRSAFYSKFREYTGQSIGNYINSYRVKRAKEMLDNKDMPISEISDALGFSSQRYFSTFFKEKTGLSPRSYRTREKN